MSIYLVRSCTVSRKSLSYLKKK